MTEKSIIRGCYEKEERGAGSGERKSGNELSAETSTKIQNGGPKNEREKEEDKERNSCLG